MVLVMLLCTCAVDAVAAEEPKADHVIVLSAVDNKDGTYTNTATCDGVSVNEYNYVWHADPATATDYYTGTEPKGEAVYVAHDITYFPLLNTGGFTKVQYDDDREWAYYYTASGYTDFIFATLPVLGNSLPTGMMHSAQEAYQNAVLHITKAGVYEISGEWHGQIMVDLGDEDDVFANSDCKVTLILNGVDITCTVAPAVNFYSVYECDNTWEEAKSHSKDVVTAEAGANVYLAEGSVNDISGANVFRMLKAKYKKDTEQSRNARSVKLQKKMVKEDAAFYSYESLNIDGSGTLNITSTYEGLDSELHLTINGGNINIFSQDDGINVNEDGVSVVTFNGGCTHIYAGLGAEGDGIDSNGYLVIKDGTVISAAKPNSADSGLDSDRGTYIYGGTVVALGSSMDGVAQDENGQVVADFNFSRGQQFDEAIILTDTANKVVFAYDQDQDEQAKGSTAKSYQRVIVSTPELTKGSTYHLYIGGDVTGTNDGTGLFTAKTATGFTDAAVMQRNSRSGGASTEFTMSSPVNSFSNVSDNSGGDPGYDPGYDPGRDPGRDPGTDPGRDPGTDPGGGGSIIPNIASIITNLFSRLFKILDIFRNLFSFRIFG